jgi:hypothetical protein
MLLYSQSFEDGLYGLLDYDPDAMPRPPDLHSRFRSACPNNSDHCRGLAPKGSVSNVKIGPIAGLVRLAVLVRFFALVRQRCWDISCP